MHKKNLEEKLVKKRELIVIKKARENNLRSVNALIPKNQFTVITGVSGSGKSSLAFDTLYAEGYRRFVENLSSGAKLLVHAGRKPQVEKIENLAPAIAVSQNAARPNVRSTVGTFSGIMDFWRSIFLIFGKAHCPVCDHLLEKRTTEEIVNGLKQLKKGTRIVITAPWKSEQPLTWKEKINLVASQGYARIKLGEKIVALAELSFSDESTLMGQEFEVVVDRLNLGKNALDKERIIDSLLTASRLFSSSAKVWVDGEEKFSFQEGLFCPRGCFSSEELELTCFSFNSQKGACPKCSGLGELAQANLQKIIPNPRLSLAEGAVVAWFKNGGRKDGFDYYQKILEALGKRRGFSVNVPVEKIPAKKLKSLFWGEKKPLKIIWQGTEKEILFEGIIKMLEDKYQQADNLVARKEVEKYFVLQTCPECLGGRLKKEYLAVRLFDKNISQLAQMEISQLVVWMQEKRKLIQSWPLEGQDWWEEIEGKLRGLVEAGVGYLSLDRTCQSLSGGEFQKIKIASQLNDGLSGVIYVLDEPTVGLHGRDSQKLINLLKKIRDKGNTVVVVEHDQQMMQAADWILDLGPGAGVEGGQLVFQGTLEQMKKEKTLTAKYLFQKENKLNKKQVAKFAKKEMSAKNIVIYQVEHHNLKGFDLKIPLGKIVTFCGVSGSGKSSLVEDVLSKSLKQKLYHSEDLPGKHRKIEGIENINRVAIIDQIPLGRSSRSNPATYSGIFNQIRELFAKTKEAQQKRFTASYFSFNMKGGRCEYCQGEGELKNEVNWLEDIRIICPYCSGLRYNKKALEIKYHGMNIAQVLNMDIQYARAFFSHMPAIGEKLEIFCRVGLGYLKLGQDAFKLSGGEAQRIKLATELAKKSNGKTLYILDEPTMGLHFADIEKLFSILRELTEKGNSIILVEHNLEVIRNSDWVIELGPEGGALGGEIVFQGVPEDLLKAQTWTARALKGC